jgi:hypothetical protein
MFENLIIKSLKDTVSYLSNKYLSTSFEHTEGFSLDNTYLYVVNTDNMQTSNGTILSTAFLALAFHYPNETFYIMSLFTCLGISIGSLVMRMQNYSDLTVNSLALITTSSLVYNFLPNSPIKTTFLIGSEIASIALLTYAQTRGPYNNHST